MSFVIFLHGLSVSVTNVLELAVLTTQRFPANKFIQHFLHIKQSWQCGTVEKITGAAGYGFKSY